jgi:hypothetical protein
MNARGPAILAFAAFAALLTFGTPADAQTRSLTIAWDRSPEPFVAGYFVYVGPRPGVYDEQYDVGNQESFVYDRVVSGHPYYFAVAAYAANAVVGPRSEEIIFRGDGGAASPLVSSATGRAQDDVSEPRSLCATAGDRRCYNVEPVASVDGAISALIPTLDGRLFVLENQQRVRVVQNGRVVPAPALISETATALGGLVVDPEFSSNRFVYVLEVRTTRSGREASVVRYREIGNVLGEGAAIVAALPMPTVGDAVMTIGADGRLYIALPEERQGAGRSSYGGMVLRFERNGAVPVDSPARSPIFATGLAQPAAIAWTNTPETIWLAGADADPTLQVARLSLAAGAVWPRTPSPVGTNASVIPSTPAAIAHVAFVDAQGNVVIVEAAEGGVHNIARLETAPLGMAVAAAFGTGQTSDDLFVAIADSTLAVPSSRIFLLQR